MRAGERPALASPSMQMTAAIARRPTSMSSSWNAEHGLARYSIRARSADLAGLSRLEHAPSGAGRGSACRRHFAATAAGELDPDLHDERGWVSGPILSALSAGCAVRQ